MARPIVTVGIPFLTVILAVSFFDRRITLIVMLVCLVCLLLTALFLRDRKRFVVFLILAAAILGCFRWTVYLKQHDYQTADFSGKSYHLTGVIQDMGRTKSGNLFYTIAVTSHNLDRAPQHFTALLYTSDEIDADGYDTVSLDAKCLPTAKTPDFDIERYNRSNGVDLTFYGSGKSQITKAKTKPLLYYIKAMSRSFCETLDNALPEPYAGQAKAILLGNSSTLDDVLYDGFIRSGIAHIFVVSGSHVSLIAGFVLLLLKKTFLKKRFRALLAGAFVWIFVAMTGFTVPVVRAGIMISVILMGELFYRKADGPTSLFLAGILIVAWNPASITGGSFLLTFSSMLGMILFTKPITERMIQAFHVKRNIGKTLCSVLGMTFGCDFAMLPAFLYLFHGISIVAPLTNLIVASLLPAILLLTVLVLIFSFVPFLCSLLSTVLEALFYAVDVSSNGLGHLPVAYLGLRAAFLPFWMLLFLSLAGAAAVFLKSRKAVKRIGCIMLVGVVLLLCLQKFVDRHVTQMVPIESSGAQGVAVIHNDSAAVILLSDDKQIGKEAENCLRQRNVRRICALVLGHAKTKSVSDLVYLTKCVSTENILLNEEDPLCLSAASVFPIKGRVFGLTEKKGYQLNAFPNVTIQTEQFSDGIFVTVRDKNSCVGITNSETQAGRKNCDLLFYGAKNIKMVEQNPAKYVILLNEPETIDGPLPAKFYPAYQKNVTVRLTKDGEGLQEE